ncbi:hypothetical protein Tco_0143510 [Tanacetum coccineum]
MNTPSTEDLDNLFGPMFEEYFENRSSDTPINSAAQLTQLHEDSSSTSSITAEEHAVTPNVTTSIEQISPISLTEADEFNQEDSADFDDMGFVHIFLLSHEEFKSSSAAHKTSNGAEFTSSTTLNTCLDKRSSSRPIIIMAQQQHAADVHPDELCPPNKRYDLMDANKNIAASSSVPWIYMAQFWHTLKDDRSKYRLMFMLDRKELSLTLDDFRTIFHLSQANANNHERFMPPTSFVDMVLFYKNELGFTMELKTTSNFKTIGLLQP